MPRKPSNPIRVGYSPGPVLAVAPSPRHPCQIPPSSLRQYSLFLRPPTRSTSKPSATLPPLPRNPLPQAVHQTKSHYLVIARVETALPAMPHSAFPSRLLERLRRAAVRQIHPSHPCRAIARISRQVKWGTTDVPLLSPHRQPSKRDLKLARPCPAGRRLAARQRVAQLHRSRLPPA